MHSMFGSTYLRERTFSILKQAKSEKKIEMLTKHWVIVSDLLPLTYWY